MEKAVEKLKSLFAKAGVRWVLGYLFILFCGVGVVYYWRVAYGFADLSPWVATGVVCGGFSAIYLLVFLIAHFVQQNLALKASLLILLAGLCFVFANPPLQAPDETMHFLRAYSLGSGNFTFDQQEDYPDDVDLLVTRFPGYYNSAIIGTGQGTMADGFRRYFDGPAEGEVVPGASTLVQQVVPYVTQAPLIALARVLGGGALSAMYAARIGNLLGYAVLCYFALRVMKRFLPILIALAISPIALFTAASCSADGMLLGLTWLFIAFCFGGALSRGKVVALAASFGLVVFAKYTPLALLPLVALIPFEEKRLKNRRITAAKQRWLLAAVCLVGAGAIYLLLTTYTKFASNYGALAYADAGVRPEEQLKFMFSNPPRYFAVFLYSLYRDKANLFSTGTFGWMDMVVPFINYFTPLVLLFSAALSALEGAREERRTGWLAGLSAFLMYAFTYAGMYLTSTPFSLPEINGVQSRYLLGAFFLLLVLVAILIGRTMALQYLREVLPQKTPPAWRMLHLAFCYALLSALLLFQSYYIGP